MISRLLKIILALVMLSGMLSGSEAHASTIQLPKTGLTGCWDAAGGVIACATTGQDGDKLKGIAPPAPRFTDNGNGTVTDNQTGLIWLKNANCFGTQVWATALTSANNLASGSCGLTDGSLTGDWRLPNIVELESLVVVQNLNPALLIGHPFSSVQNNWYWSSSSYVGSTGDAWFVNMVSGYVDKFGKTNGGYVWPVRAGQVGNSVISASPANKAFGSVTTGTTSSAQTFTISNSGSALIVSGIATTSGNSGMFSINPGNGSAGTCGSLTPTIALGASCTVSATFTPSSGGGKFTTLRISSNDPVTPTKDIGLTGDGVFTIGTGVVGGNGSIACAPSATVIQYGNTTCTATPDAGYYIASVTVDSTAVPAAANSASYAQAFNNVTANHSMSATFSPKYTVTYNGNGNTGGAVPTDGSSPYLPGVTVTVLGNTGTLVKTGYTFAGWNTAADGSGTSYAAAATFAIAGNTTLYAKWGLNGACGTSYGAPFTITPASNLCSAGTASAVSGSGPWTWSCNGSNGGTNASCWAYLQGSVVLPKTGQTACYNAAGTVIPCAGTGQDGEKQMGAAQTDPLFTDNGNGTITDKVYGMAWKKNAGANGATEKTGIAGLPATRFTDNGNGTQTDNLTGLVWLKNGNCFGQQTWASALNSANTIASGSCGLTDSSIAGDWRLPNIDR